MNRSLAFILTAIALTFTGCKADGGKADSNGAPAPAAAQRPTATDLADRRPTIVCFGDSLTAGYGTDPGESYPDYLQELLTRDGYPYRVSNAGVSGNTTKDGLDRLPRLIARKPALVVLEFGGNDGLRGLPLEQTEANLGSMIEQLQAAGIPVALAGITLPPNYSGEYIKQFNGMYSTLARKNHLPFLPFLLQGVYGTPGGMQDDATHATAQGNRQVAANVEKLITPLLRR
jgi:acyl-CoA thioesterase-1